MGLATGAGAGTKGDPDVEEGVDDLACERLEVWLGPIGGGTAAEVEEDAEALVCGRFGGAGADVEKFDELSCVRLEGWLGPEAGGGKDPSFEEDADGLDCGRLLGPDLTGDKRWEA